MRSMRYLLGVFGLVNISLAIFNLIPIPPLDGSNVLAGLNPGIADAMAKLRRSGQSMIIFLLVFAFAGKYITPWSTQIALGFLRRIRGY